MVAHLLWEQEVGGSSPPSPTPVASARRPDNKVPRRRYRQGDHDYDRRYGSREEYARDYRAAFERGYREGYDAVRRDDRRW